MKSILQLLMLLFVSVSSAQVGIGTTNPQRDLHIAGEDSTIRIESLNNVNQPVLNAGRKLAPVYVTGDGDLTLAPSGYVDGVTLPGTLEPLNFLINIPNFVPNGPYGDGTVVANPATVLRRQNKLSRFHFQVHKMH